MKRANWLKRLPSRGLGFLSQLGWGELQLKERSRDRILHEAVLL